VRTPPSVRACVHGLLSELGDPRLARRSTCLRIFPIRFSVQQATYATFIKYCYSIDYRILHTTWHDWKAKTGGRVCPCTATQVQRRLSSTTSSSDGKGITTSDISKGWHVWGIWVDATTIHWYLDGKEIYTAPTKGSAPL